MSAVHQEDATVTVRSRSWLAAVVGVWLTHPVLGMEPVRLGLENGSAVIPGQKPSPNQQIANAIAENLRQSGQLRHYTIHISFQNSTAELTGAVADPMQRDE